MADVSAFMASLALLPKDVDPYRYVYDYMHVYAIPVVPSWFNRALKANYAIASLGVAAACITLVAKALSGGLRLARRRKTALGTIYAPNTTLVLTMASLMFFAFSIANGRTYLRIFDEGKETPASAWLIPFLWLPILYIVLSESHGAFVAAILFRYQTGSQTQSLGWKASGSRQYIKTWPAIAINAFFLGGYLLMTILLLTYHLQAAVTVTSAMGQMKQLSDQLLQSSSTWTTGQAFKLAPAFISLSTEFQYKYSTVYLNQTVAGFYVLAGLLAGETVLVFLPAATLYHQMLGKRLQTLRSATFDQKRIAPLERSYLLLRLQSVAIFCVACVYIGLLFAMAAQGMLFADGQKLARYMTCALYFYTILCCPLTCMLALRAIRPLLHRHQDKVENSSGVKIQTTRQVVVDQGDKDYSDTNACPIEYIIPPAPVSRKPNNSVQLINLQHTGSLAEDADGDTDLEKTDM